MDADRTTKTSTFKFETQAKPEDVAISTGGISSSTFALSLFRDVNGNNVLDNGDASGLIQANNYDTPNSEDGAFELLNVFVTQDVYSRLQLDRGQRALQK